jgi:cellulose synthase/poly-beta-1,6-N-acetylglucosamine synthase-like glycosyltransferase
MAQWFSLDNVLITAYLVVLLTLAMYGLHRSMLMYLYYRSRGADPSPLGRFDPTKLPVVTVQLPLFNEMYVAARLLDAIALLDYPRDKLEIQVLDDSTDETQAICKAKVEELSREGLDIQYIHRTDRTGFKAGALEHGLTFARGEYVMVFDADFLPAPDIIERTVHFFTNDKVGMVQVRWDHVNRDYSGRFFNFNGTAGIWRRSAITDAGGWSHDTLTEDMDLSYRAQLRGWEFIYLKDVVSPAELPVEMNAFKSQQFRWAKGSIQVAKKLLPTIWRSKDVPFNVKLEAFFHLTNNFAYPLLLLLSILLLPNLLVRTQHADGDDVPAGQQLRHGAQRLRRHGELRRTVHGAAIVRRRRHAQRVRLHADHVRGAERAVRHHRRRLRRNAHLPDLRLRSDVRLQPVRRYARRSIDGRAG